MAVEDYGDSRIIARHLITTVHEISRGKPFYDIEIAG